MCESWRPIYATRNYREAVFRDRYISRSVRGPLSEVERIIFSQESTEASRYHEVTSSSAIISVSGEADSYLRGIIIPTISSLRSWSSAATRRAARTYFSDLQRYHGKALIPPPPYPPLLVEIHTHVQFGIYAPCTSPGNYHPKSPEIFFRIELFIRELKDRETDLKLLSR